MGGDLTGSGAIHNGRVYVGGEAQQESGFTAGCGVWSPPTEPPVDFAALEEEINGIVVALANYPVNGGVNDTTGTLRFIGDDPELNVFSVTTEQIESASEISIEVPLTSTVIINVEGETLSFEGKGFKLPDGASCRGGDADFCAQIVWNMPNVTSLVVSGIGIQGSVFAPNAAFSGDGGNVDGQVIVQSLVGSIEFHPYFFEGCLELPESMAL